MIDTPATPETPTSRFAPKAWIVWPLFVLALACVAAAIFVPIKRKDPASNTGPINAVPNAYFQAPIFELKERGGADVTSVDLQGKVWVAAFIFTRCKMGCEEVTATMVKLQSELNLAEADDLRLVTFTVDPERDTMDDLKAYATKVKSHPTKWLYLTGTEKYVRLLLKQGFKVTADKKEGGKPGDEFEHTTKLYVIDKFGNIRGSFDGKQGANDLDGQHYAHSQERLKTLVAELRKEQ
jgi:cytochrome oxidase Cu insertion factor (SCO1/SenC/PrrC family)